MLYSPERLLKIAQEATKVNSMFSLNDRISIIHDAFALSGAGYTRLSSVLDLVMEWRSESECTHTLLLPIYCSVKAIFFADLVWRAIRNELGAVVRVWRDDEVVSEKLMAFCRVGFLHVSSNCNIYADLRLHHIVSLSAVG